MSENIKSLIHKRGIIKGQLTRFIRFLDDFELNKTDLSQLKNRLNDVKLLLDKFSDIQTNLEISDTDTSPEEHDQNREVFENSYYSVLSRAQNILDEVARKETESVASTQQRATENSTRNISLPPINLGTFDGSFQNWLFFKDTFTSLIHNNKHISDIQRFHYLRLSLKGEAAEVISALEISSANYNVAWQLLHERFENKTFLINNHVKSIFNLSNITKESFVSLRSLLDNLTKHLRALQVLKLPVDQWDVLLIHLVGSKLDLKTRREWEERCVGPDLPKFNDLENFLKNKCRLLENLQSTNTDSKFQNDRGQNSRENYSHLSTENVSCVLCKQNHIINSCPKFYSLSIKSRWTEIKRLNLCHNCLKGNHSVKFCKSVSCKKCHKRHHTLLHDPEFYANFSRNNSDQTNASKIDQPCTNNKSESESQNQEAHGEDIRPQTTHALSNPAYSHTSQILLSTAIIQVLDRNGKIYEARAMLDSGSQSNFITNSLCNKLKLSTSDISYTISGINQKLSNINARCQLKIQSRYDNYQATLSCLVLSKITDNLPSVSFDKRILNIPHNIQLADPTFDQAGDIDILIGAEIFWDLLSVGQIKLGRTKPNLQRTRLGWIVSGLLNSPSVIQQTNKTNCHFVSSHDIDIQLTKFWELETINESKTFTSEEQACELNFTEKTVRNKDGRFVVAIPFKESLELLGESRQQAEKQFYNLERRLQKNHELLQLYTEFLNEYEQMGHMIKVSNPEQAKFSYYMPHHGVFREHSETTRLRCVFNASAPTSTGKSLNDLQMVGPVLQRDLFSILLSFRIHKYVVTADIAKMYRQVLVRPEQTPLLRILWRTNPSIALETYELQTVTYGTASASFLAVRCLFELADECQHDQPQIAEIIKSDFYMDDLLTGANNVEDAANISVQIKNILRQGGFDLRKWRSNDKRVIQNLNPHDLTNVNLGANKNSKTLGLMWSCETDNFTFDIDLKLKSTKVTKRSILSETAQIFDPLGLLSPCTITPKIILQHLWQEKLSWDSAVPLHLNYKWITFRNQLHTLNKITIPRRVVCDNYETLELHGFADSSKQAYGSCIYLRSTDLSGNVCCKLVCAKTRVAPLKTITIPRLELCAALLLAKLVDKVRNSMKLKFDKFYYWSDSKITLSWIKSTCNRWQVFVANRISEIQSLTSPNDWHYVNTTENPADLLSRGIEPKTLLECNLWWEGPSWLSLSSDLWPIGKPEIFELQNYPEDVLVEMQKDKKVVGTVSVELNFIENYSNLNRLTRVTAYCLRFKNNASLTKNIRNYGPLSPTEIQNALNCLILSVQKFHYRQELNDLFKSGSVNSKSKLFALTPFLDVSGILRVGGRLKHSNFDDWKKHPAVLPSNHHLSYLIAENEHKRLLHAGPQLLLASLRDRYWFISGRNLAKKIVHKCIRCFRFNAKNVQAIMGDLPKARVTPARPFLNSGVDYAGPFYIRDRKTRNYKKIKAYVCLFVCFATKAVHLELVGDLTSESFLATLRRFMARRGKCLNLYSDNGSNFVGANTELRDFLLKTNNQISTDLCLDGITWHFIPPRAPHFGGLWEAGVKSTKYHIKRVIGESILCFEEFMTVLTQVEACLNSRPLYPLSHDPNDPEPLTPAHFLIGEAITTIPDPNLKDIPETRLNRFQSLQQMTQHFWTRWSKEYISELQVRQKWKTHHAELLRPGVLVIIKEDNLPPLKWHLGRILELHPGSDDITRVVTVKTTKGVYKRPISRVCVLPCEGSV